MQFLNLEKQYKSIKKEIDAAIKRVLDGGVFVGGKEVEGFEKEISRFCKTKHAIAVNSGTDALFLALKSLGVTKGDEVITTPFTFIATAEAIVNSGAKPVFVDIDPKTFNIDCSEIEKAVTKKTKAIIPVHLFGQQADMEEVMKVAKKYNLFVVEDAAQSIGSAYKKKKAGSLGDMGCLSFFPSKNLGAYGDGGMVITNNIILAEKIRLLRTHGSSPKDKYKNLILGTNSRLDTLQAAVLRVKLRYLDAWNKKRREAAAYYTKSLKETGGIAVPFISAGNSHTFYSYVVRVKKKRDELALYLKRSGIQTMVYYPLPLHLQPAFKYLGYRKGDFPEAEKAAKEVLSLPIYPEIGRKEQDFVIKAIKKFYEKKD
jgi:dTDP-4-amino-4,6-dideoxygalactose transaminase